MLTAESSQEQSRTLALVLARLLGQKYRHVLVGTLAVCFVSAGLANGVALVVVDEGSATTYIEALQDLPNAGDPTGWIAPVYDTSQDIGKGDPSNGSSGWQGGVHSVGMADGDDNTTIVWDGSVYSVYTRTEFDVTDASVYSGMSLEIDYDDGYVVWLNGTEIHRSFSMQGVDPVWNASTTITHEASNARIPGPPIELNAFTSSLVNGTNVLAIGTWNWGFLNSDMTLIPRLTLFNEPFVVPDPFHCYLTWQNDTSTTMTVNYHTRTDTGTSRVYYDTVSRDGIVASYAHMGSGTSHHVPGLGITENANRTVHVVELSKLEPGQDYYFIAGDPVTGYTDEKRFRTIPSSGEPIRFVTGGDMDVSPIFRDLLTHAAAEEPMFGLLGGDIAYANGLLPNWERWERWLDWWEELMVTPQGRTVPIVMAIGNHEVDGGNAQFGDPLGNAPFYFGYFAQDGVGFSPGRKAYFSRTFGANSVVLALDTGHVTPIDGAQKTWMQQELASASPFKNTFAVYHVPMYPSHRSFFGPTSVLLRDHWIPIFDNFGLTTAFENHDHMLKRTKLLKNSAPHPEGTLYLGDGCFGRLPRPGVQAQVLDSPGGPESIGLTESYLATWSPSRHFWLVEIPAGSSGGPGTIDFTAIDENGLVVDSYALGIGLGLRGLTTPWIIALSILLGGLAVFGFRRTQ